MMVPGGVFSFLELYPRCFHYAAAFGDLGSECRPAPDEFRAYKPKRSIFCYETAGLMTGAASFRRGDSPVRDALRR